MLTTPTDAPAAVQRFLGDDEEAEEHLTELRAEVCDIIRAMDGGGITKPKDAPGQTVRRIIGLRYGIRDVCIMYYTVLK